MRKSTEIPHVYRAFWMSMSTFGEITEKHSVGRYTGQCFGFVGLFQRADYVPKALRRDLKVTCRVRWALMGSEVLLHMDGNATSD
jgi:hypothetical protein